MTRLAMGEASAKAQTQQSRRLKGVWGPTTTAPIRDVRCEKGENMTDDNTQTSLNDKGRYWAGLIYPDSCPDDWKATMQMSGLQILVSPVHDKDIEDPKTGKLKKPHRHVVAMWTNTTTRRNATRFFEQFNGPKTILRVESPRGMARYLVHLDNPEKVQYLPEDVIEITGADWKKIALTDEERPEVMELLELIEEWEVHGYFELLKLCELKKPKLLPVAAKATTYCREVIWSYWQFKERNSKFKDELMERQREELRRKKATEQTKQRAQRKKLDQSARKSRKNRRVKNQPQKSAKKQRRKNHGHRA